MVKTRAQRKRARERPTDDLALWERAKLGTKNMGTWERMQMANDMAQLPPEMVQAIALQQPTFEGYRNAFYMAGMRPIINEPVMDRYVVREVKDVMWDHAPDELQRTEITYKFNGKMHRGGGLPAMMILNADGAYTSIVFQRYGIHMGQTYGAWMGTASVEIDRENPDMRYYRFRGPVFAGAFDHFGVSVVNSMSQMFFLVVHRGELFSASVAPTPATHVIQLDSVEDRAWLAQYFRPYMSILDTRNI
jgi:hypothetical protein